MKNANYKLSLGIAMVAVFLLWKSIGFAPPTNPSPNTASIVVNPTNMQVVWPANFFASNVSTIASALNSAGSGNAITNLSKNVAQFTNALICTEVPSASTNPLPSSGNYFLAIDGTNVYFGQANIGGSGTNWMQIALTGF